MPLSPTLEAFLVIEQPRQRFGHWSRILSALDAPAAPPLASVIALYDPTIDQALLDVRYDQVALGKHGLAFLVSFAVENEIGMIQPAELSEGERKRFLGERLARCTMEVTTRRDVVGALAELVRRLRDYRSASKPPPVPPAAMRAPSRADTVVELVKLARGTRDDIGPRKDGVPTLPPLPRPDGTYHARRNIIARVQREPTAELTPSRAIELLAEPYSPTSTQAKVIHARYLRSGRWIPVRVGALSLRGGALLAGALPRFHDRVDLALSYGANRALVRGVVAKVSTLDDTRMTGAASFSVDFELDDISRVQLVKLLTAARAEKVTIKPPPPRTTQRFPVEWPMCLGTTRGAVRAEALDVSLGGMFVRPAFALDLDTIVSFSIVLEEGGTPIAGRTKIVRQIGEDDAKTLGIEPGYGLSIVDMTHLDRERWTACPRVERRADKRVLVGATPARLAELQQGLAAVGYAVSGGVDPGALVQLANSGERPVDAALIDAGWLADGSAAQWLQSLFSSRNVPCVTMQGDVRRARLAIDRLLLS
jgi:hypothetical protein